MSSRAGLREQRISRLIERFDHYVDLYDREVPFRRFGQFEHHLATITIRRSLPDLASAIQNQEFLVSLRDTLRAWGIGVRGSIMREGPFGDELRRWSDSLVALDKVGLATATDQVRDEIWRLVQVIRIVENKARLVALTKTLHHLLPDLVVPIDRTYTGPFFGWQPMEFQSNQRRIFNFAWNEFRRIAAASNPERLVGEGWRTSTTKVIDNAIVGFCMEEELSESKPAMRKPLSTRRPRRLQWTVEDLRSDLASFEEELRKARLRDHTIQTYAGRSKTFVDWLEGRYEPRGPND
jgi:hypothetical protein